MAVFVDGKVLSAEPLVGLKLLETGILRTATGLSAEPLVGLKHIQDG